MKAGIGRQWELEARAEAFGRRGSSTAGGRRARELQAPAEADGRRRELKPWAEVAGWRRELESWAEAGAQLEVGAEEADPRRELAPGAGGWKTNDQ